MLHLVVVWGLNPFPLFWEISQHVAASSLVCLGPKSPKYLTNVRLHYQSECVQGSTEDRQDKAHACVQDWASANHLAAMM